MNATNQVIPPAPLFYRHLQMDLAKALRAADQDYETTLTLSQNSREKLSGWDIQMVKIRRETFLDIKLYFPLEVDLFASRLTSQCRRYFSWRPDPFAEATDAFLQDWTVLKGFANPP
jgi:hypothetical protein